MHSKSAHKIHFLFLVAHAHLFGMMSKNALTSVWVSRHPKLRHFYAIDGRNKILSCNMRELVRLLWKMMEREETCPTTEFATVAQSVEWVFVFARWLFRCSNSRQSTEPFLQTFGTSGYNHPLFLDTWKFENT